MNNEKLFKKITITVEDTYNKNEKTLSFKTQYSDGLELKELLNLFRQLMVILSYTDTTAKRLVVLEEGDMELLGLSDIDLNITEA